MEVRAFRFDPADGMPNSPLPLLFIPAGFAQAVKEGEVESAVRAHGWTGTWVQGVFDYWHYQTRGHEVLVGMRGFGRVGFGGEDGEELEMTAGDVVIIPAGVGHKGLDASSDFAVLGAYPPGQDGAIVRAGEKDLRAADEEIGRLKRPVRDPVTGGSPGLLHPWWNAA